LHHYNYYNYHAIFDDSEELSGSSLTFAVQNGQTYIGGFKICPDAKIDDGILNVCISQGTMNRAAAFLLFYKIKYAKHVDSSRVLLKTAKKLKISFEGKPPCQVDGEPFEAEEYEVSVLKHALNVLKFDREN
ncbi:MAG: diacylglycerol kinase family lipid kinase, partial [Eggerthellaceae bacterium]|nr:diacylglycerol kinase family lipid kinase [Eggerthellaceae bacterium]